MEKEARKHIHPISAKEIFGRKLDVGDKIIKGDVYDSTTGKWMISSFAGHLVPYGEHVIWVRPEHLQAV
ncbi:MAG: hypothetical protein AAB840_02775 [Patescibacteria group bacterium]